MPHITIELSIRRRPDTSLVAELRAELPRSRADLGTTPVSINCEELLALSHNPNGYGATLSAMALPPALHPAWQRARGYADREGEGLHVRVMLDDLTGALHALRWELLRDPTTNVPLAQQEGGSLARLVLIDDLHDPAPPAKTALRALVAVAGPSDVSRFGLAPVDVPAEARRAVEALGGIPVELLADTAPGAAGLATLAHISAGLRGGAHILYLICHGQQIKQGTALYLVGDDGKAEPTSGAVLTSEIASLDAAHRPLLAVLVACESASQDDAPLASVGPLLARAGIPAVVAMQAKISMAAAARLTARLLRELARDGRIDRALAAARRELGNEWWVPVLWLRARDGRLWDKEKETPQESAPPFIATPGLYQPCPRRVGHAAVAADLRARLQAATTRKAASMVLLESPPGYGKHALLQELAHACSALGGLVMGVTFDPPPHAPDFAPPVTVAVPANLPAQVAAHWPQGAAFGDHWCQLMAQAQVALQRSRTPGIISGMGETPEALLSILRQVAYNGLVVLLLEHWERAGPAWDVLLGELITAVGRNPMRLLVVLTCDRVGITPVTTDHTFLDVAIATEAVERHVLSRVTADDLAAVVGSAQPDIPRRLYRLSEGHPALALNLWDLWVLTEAVTQDNAGIWQAKRSNDDALWVEDSIGDLARKLVRIRLGHTPPLPLATVQHMLAVAALEGPVFTAQALADALGVDEDDLLDTCDDYLLNEDPDASVVREVGPVIMNTRLDRYRFALPYLHLVFARELSGAARSDAALALAVALERRYQPAPEQIADVLVTLFTLGGDPARAETYRIQRKRDNREHANEFVLRWTITALGQQGHAGTWQLCDAHLALASWLYDHGRYAEGMPEAQAAYAIAERLDDQIRIAEACNWLAGLHDAKGDYAAARPLFERALAIREARLGLSHPDTASSLNNLAGLLKAEGDDAAARPLYTRALAIREARLGPSHPDTATSLNNLAALLKAEGDYAAARPLFERALAIYEARLGPSHPDTATSLNNLALLLESEGDDAAARPLYTRALAICEASLGPTHPVTASSLNNLAGLLHAEGDYAAARPLLARALAIREQALGPDHPDTQGARRSLAAIEQRLHEDH